MRVMPKTNWVLIAVLAFSTLAFANPLSMIDFGASRTHDHKQIGLQPSRMVPDDFTADVPCVDGFAGEFPCDGIDLLSFTPLSDMVVLANRNTSVEASDIWGWTSADTGDDYVIMGKTDGTAFFRVTDPSNPVYLGDMVNTGQPRIWHDIKIFDDHAFVVSESTAHGMQVFDLTRLDGVTDPQLWDFDVNYLLESTDAHNIAINTETGFAYIIGGGPSVGTGCGSGLHMVDINDPLSPSFAGCFSGDGYVHDTQCVVYRGPDEDYFERELCFNSAEDQLGIIDVTDKSNPVRVADVAYENPRYTHQAWLTEDHRFLILGDELDEGRTIENTRTIIWDLSDLDSLGDGTEFFHDTTAIDHNLYTLNGLVYMSNYTAGLRVMTTAPLYDDATPLSEGLEEVAFFDTYPDSEAATFDGTWSNYPYFGDGVIAVTGIGEGLFMLQVQDDVLAAEEFAPNG